MIPNVSKFAKYLNNDAFKASNKWLGLFIKRSNIVFRIMTGGRGDIDTTAVDGWKKRHPVLCDVYSPIDIFNINETGFPFRERNSKN